MNFISGELCVCMLTLNHEFVKAFCNLINVNRWSAVDKEKGVEKSCKKWYNIHIKFVTEKCYGYKQRILGFYIRSVIRSRRNHPPSNDGRIYHLYERQNWVKWSINSIQDVFIQGLTSRSALFLRSLYPNALLVAASVSAWLSRILIRKELGRVFKLRWGYVDETEKYDIPKISPVGGWR